MTKLDSSIYHPLLAQRMRSFTPFTSWIICLLLAENFAKGCYDDVYLIEKITTGNPVTTLIGPPVFALVSWF
jgi:hypothetical protein